MTIRQQFSFFYMVIIFMLGLLRRLLSENQQEDVYAEGQNNLERIHQLIMTKPIRKIYNTFIRLLFSCCITAATSGRELQNVHFQTLTDSKQGLVVNEYLSTVPPFSHRRIIASFSLLNQIFIGNVQAKYIPQFHHFISSKNRPLHVHTRIIHISFVFHWKWGSSTQAAS